MAVLQKGKANYPFWGASINLITGLDPLSLQTTSEATYATMLPGISNLTNRMRYYGFYCWLLDFYFKKETKGNSTDQYRFIRRAELMVAIIMRSERREVTQITGSDFAADLINNHSGDVFDLAAGADKTNENTKVYWKYAAGAFGQYYYGAMRAISLVVAAANEEGDVIYSITQQHPRQKVSGRELADAFDSGLTPAIRDRFYDNIRRGKLNSNDIPELVKYFYIDTIGASTAEWPLYVAMLLDKDDPGLEVEENFTYHRRATIIELINSTLENKGKYDWHQLLLKSYKLKLESTDTIKGWYAYQFNEYYQYGCGAIFWATLQHLYSFQQDQYVPAFVDKWAESITKEICKQVSNVNPVSSLKEVLSLLPARPDVESIYHSIETKPESNPVTAAAYGFKLLFKLYLENKEELQPLKEFMARKQMIREGNVIDGLLYLHTRDTNILKDFIEQFVLRRIIYRHQMVAIRKMGNGSQSTHKFIIEEQYIRFIDTFPPRGTSPRMDALWNLLFDLIVVDAEDKLTPLHKKLLEI